MKGFSSMRSTSFALSAAAAVLFCLSMSPAEAQRARSMYSVEGASGTPATTQSTGSPLEGTWVGTVNRKDGGTRSTTIKILAVSGYSASVDRDNGDKGSGSVSGNTVSFGKRNPMVLTVSGRTATLTGTYENGVAVNGTLKKR
jgi:hypothetical protein